jgi:hypothetical protein
MAETPPVLLSPVPLAQPSYADLLHCFNDRAIRRPQRFPDGIDFQSFHQKIYVVANALKNDKDTQVSDPELNALFGRSGGWAQAVIARRLRQLNSEKPIARGRRKLAESDMEKKVIRFCLVGRSEKTPVTVESPIDLMTTMACESPGSRSAGPLNAAVKR